MNFSFHSHSDHNIPPYQRAERHFLFYQNNFFQQLEIIYNLLNELMVFLLCCCSPTACCIRSIVVVVVVVVVVVGMIVVIVVVVAAAFMYSCHNIGWRYNDRYMIIFTLLSSTGTFRMISAYRYTLIKYFYFVS